MNAIDAALSTKLGAATALTTALGGALIYNGVAPEGAALPFVVFNQQSGREDNATPRRTGSFYYLVKGVGSSLYVAGQLADLIDAALHNATLSVSGWTNYWMHRMETVRYIEPTAAGGFIGHAGAVYEVLVSL